MKRLLLIIVALLCSTPIYAQAPIKICFPTNGPNCQDVTATNPFPVAATATISFPTIGSAVPSTGIYNGINVAGTLRGWSGLSTGSIFPGAVAIVDGSGNQITSFGSSTSLTPVTPASATATQSTLLGGQFATTQPTFTNGQQGYIGVTSRGELLVSPGVSNFAVQAAQSGTWNITNISGTISLPTGASTSANQITSNAPITPASATATTSLLIGGQYNSTQATFTNGQQGSLQVTARGELKIVNMDAAGNARGANVNASNQLSVSVDGTNNVAGSVSNASSGVATGSTNVPNVSYNYGFNGTTWDQLQVDASKNLKVAITPNTAGGLTTSFFQPAASDNHTNLKNGAGQVYWVLAENNSATVNYLRFYNAATGFNGCNSATNLITQIQIPASTSVGGVNISLPLGIAFSTGISYCVTSGYATTDTTNATASAMSITIGYN